MANRRMLSGDLFEDDFVGSLTFLKRLLWIGIITTVADDQGRLMDNPALIRSRVFLYDQDVKDEHIEESLKTLEASSKIVRYASGNKQLIQIVNWWKYQTPAWASPSKYPAPINWMDRHKYHAPGNKIVTCNWDKIGGYVVDYVPVLDRAIEEGDVKGDGDGKGEDKGEELPPTPFDLFQAAAESNGIPVSTKTAVDAIEGLLKEGAIVEDLEAGIRWKIAHNEDKPVQYFSQLVGPTITAMKKRLQNSNGHNPPVQKQRLVIRDGQQVIEDIP